MHLVVYFCGTGNPGDNFESQAQYLHGNKDLRTVFVQGCEQPEVCNSELFPDLDAFAKRFTPKLFGKNGQLKTIDATDLASVGIRADRTTLLPGDENEKIESITLCGYSRGAVTCFEVAKQLNKIAPNIPVDIVADQPVPGNLYQAPGTNASSVADCSDLKNLRNVSVILGSYTGALANVDLHVKLAMPDNLDKYKTSYLLVGDNLYYINEESKVSPIAFHSGYNKDNVLKHFKIDAAVEGKHSIPSTYLTEHFAPEAQRETTNPIHRGFFSQILPKLPRSTHRDLIVIPRESHHQDRANAPGGVEHMHMQIAKYLNKKGLVSQEDAKAAVDVARNTYSRISHIPPNPFPQVSQMQSFFGLPKEEAYRYVDKLSPIANLRKGMMFKPDESLMDWWKRHDKNTSYFSTQLTKDLVKTIQSTAKDDVEQLKTLLQHADKWLVLKENSNTSRFDQVECLRNNIHHQLITTHGVSKQELAQLNRDCLEQTNYFLKHWTVASSAASWFKTNQTRTLDKAFAEHAKTHPHSEEADRTLMNAMDDWLKDKKDSNSSRYDLVVSMREHLEKIVENTYTSSLMSTPTYN